MAISKYELDLENQLLAESEDNATGYGNGNSHEYWRDTHRAIDNSVNDEYNQAALDSTENLNRASLRLKMSLDSARSLGEMASLPEEPVVRQGRTFSRAAALTSTASVAAAEPLRAASTAAVERLAPGAPNEIKTAGEFYFYQLGSMQARREKRTTFDWIADTGALFLPFRQNFANTKMGGSWLNPTVYYKKVDDWWHQSVQDRNAQWDSLEAQLWDASGNNYHVYSALTMPFVQRSAKLDTQIFAAIEAAGSLFDVYSVASTARAVKLRQASHTADLAAKFRARAKVLGNDKAAGAAAVSDLKKGDLTAAIEATAPTLNLEGDIENTLLKEMNVPTYEAMLEEKVRTGELLPGQDVVANMSPLDETLRKNLIDRYRQKLQKGGTIVSESIADNGYAVDFDILRYAEKQVPITDAAKEGASLVNRLKELRLNRKALALDSTNGSNAEAIKAIDAEIDLTNKKLSVVTQSLRRASKIPPETGTVKVSIVEPRVDRVRMRFTVNDVGEWEFRDDAISSIARAQGSQETRVGNLERGIVGQGQWLRQQQRSLFHQLDSDVQKIKRTLRRGFLGIGRNEGQEVDSLLQTGSRLGKVFSETELRHGVEVDGIGLISFNKRQQDAYYAMREVYDRFHPLANELQRRSLNFDGHSAFNLFLQDSKGVVTKRVQVFGKARPEDIIHVVPTVGKNKIIKAMDGSTGYPVDLASVPNLEKDLNAGRKAFVELKNSFITGEADHYDYILVDLEKIGDVTKVKQAREINQVLDYLPGYVPRITTENIKFIVERPTAIVRNGEKITDTAIDRAFESRKEAQIYVEQVRAKNPDSQIMDPVTLDMAWRMDPANRRKVDFIDNQLFSGAFMGYRNPHGHLKVGLDGHDAEMMSSFEAARRYADFVSSYYPMVEYKSAIIKKFLDYAKDPRGRSLLEGNDWSSAFREGAQHDIKYRNAKSMQDWMRATFGVPNKQEIGFARFADELAHRLDTVIWKDTGMRSGGGAARTVQRALLGRRWARNPVTAAKSLVFDAYLGMFNFAQLIVQSSGMFIPATMHPLTATKIIPQFTALRALSRATDMEDAVQIAKAMGLNGTEFRTLLRAYRRSGVPQSVLENADFGHYLGTQGAFYSPTMLGRIRDKSRLFYNMGELNNRTFSFVMAFNRKASEHGWDLTKHLTDAQLLEVNQEALRLGINFGPSNKAWWQEGLMSLPTQFFQVSHKYIENAMHGLLNNAVGRALGVKGKEAMWTTTESGAAVVNGLLLWGAAGVGLDELWNGFDAWLLDTPQNGGLGLDPKDKNDALKIAGLRGGFLEMFALESLGFTPDISDRMAPAGNVAGAVNNILVPLIRASMGKGSWDDTAKALTGASNGVGTRIFRALGNTIDLLSTSVNEGDFDHNTLTQVLKELAMPVSTFSNVEKARLLKETSKLYDSLRQDTGVLELDAPSKMEILTQALGFSSIEADKLFLVQHEKKLRDEDRNNLIRQINLEYRKMFSTEGGSFVSESERVMASRKIKWLLIGLTPKDQTEIVHKALDQIDAPYQKDYFIRQLFKELYDSGYNTELEDKLRGEILIYNSTQRQPEEKK